MKMTSIDDLLYTGMTYVLDFEQRIAKEADKMAQASTDPDVKDFFEKSATQGQKYADRLETAFGKIAAKPDTNKNHVALAMIDEVENMISNTDASPVRDAALITAANQQQLYRVASYGSLRSYAKLIGKDAAVADLQQNLDESKAGDEKITAIGVKSVNPKAAQPVAV